MCAGACLRLCECAGVLTNALQCICAPRPRQTLDLLPSRRICTASTSSFSETFGLQSSMASMNDWGLREKAAAMAVLNGRVRVHGSRAVMSTLETLDGGLKRQPPAQTHHPVNGVISGWNPETSLCISRGGLAKCSCIADIYSLGKHAKDGVSCAERSSHTLVWGSSQRWNDAGEKTKLATHF